MIGCLSPGAVKQAIVQMLPGRMLVVEKEEGEVEDTITLHKEKPGEEEGKEEDDEVRGKILISSFFISGLGIYWQGAFRSNSFADSELIAGGGFGCNCLRCSSADSPHHCV